MNSAKKLIKISFDEGLLQNIQEKDNIKDSILSEENLLKPIKECEFDDTQGLFNLSPESDKFTQNYNSNNLAEENIKEVKELKSVLHKIDADINRNELELLHEEIIGLTKETKLMFNVVDKVLPRKENDVICYLLEFEDKLKPTNIKEEIEALLFENEENKEFSIGKSIRELKRLKHNIVSLRQKCFDMF